MKRILLAATLGTLCAILSGCVVVKTGGPGWSMKAASFLSSIGSASASFNTNGCGSGNFAINTLTGDQQTIATLAQVAVALAPLAFANKAPTNSVSAK
jgi:hypothetical protein